MTRQVDILTRFVRSYYRIALVATVLLACAGGLLSISWNAPTPQVIADITANPAVLTDADLASYKTAFAAQTEGDASAADSAIAQLSNTRLVGYVLAQRYLSGTYRASEEELSQWLDKYSDHPQANAIAKIANRRGLDTSKVDNDAPLKGDGYADNMGRTTMPDGWYRGLALWREKNYSAALPIFTKVGEDEAASDWARSAGYYWAYRAAVKLDDSEGADKNLKAASNFHITFYGLLASQQINGAPEIKASAPDVSDKLRNSAQAIRASLLTQLGRNDDAEEEIRHLYSDADKGDRAGLVTLAHELNLPNLQVRLARMPQLSEAEALYARYPMPEFMVDAKATNPALMLAIARNESGFRESAASGTGAVGLMQMLPSTAHAVERRVGRETLSMASAGDSTMEMRERLTNPATSVRFGEEYVKILMAEPAVGRNLIRVLAAYNAGPGTVAGWQSAAHQIDDPLLYIESIPYPETHNYVMQVMAQYWVYESMLGMHSATLEQVSKGAWPELVASNDKAL